MNNKAAIEFFVGRLREMIDRHEGMREVYAKCPGADHFSGYKVDLPNYKANEYGIDWWCQICQEFMGLKYIENSRFDGCPCKRMPDAIAEAKVRIGK